MLISSSSEEAVRRAYNGPGGSRSVGAVKASPGRTWSARWHPYTFNYGQYEPDRRSVSRWSQLDDI